MKRLGVFLLPPGWDASPSQGYRHRASLRCLIQNFRRASPPLTYSFFVTTSKVLLLLTALLLVTPLTSACDWFVATTSHKLFFSECLWKLPRSWKKTTGNKCETAVDFHLIPFLERQVNYPRRNKVGRAPTILISYECLVLLFVDFVCTKAEA